MLLNEIQSLASLQSRVVSELFRHKSSVSYKDSDSVYSSFFLNELWSVYGGQFVQAHKKILTMTAKNVEGEPERGMNSPGLLIDRLSILLCKKIFVPKRLLSTEAQISDIIWSIANSKPSKSHLLEKEAKNKSVEKPSSVPRALFELQILNFKMWINQDVLYEADPSRHTLETLQRYITSFARDNLGRNVCIEVIDNGFLGGAADAQE